MELNELNLSEEQLAMVQKFVQSETDKVRTKYSTELKTANDELAKYKPVEKSESEKALEQRIAVLEAKEKEIADKERAMTIADKLKSAGLPTELGQYLNLGDDIEDSIGKVGTAIGNYFLGQGNKPTNHSTNKGVTKSDFANYNYLQRAKLYQENPELYKALSK